LFAATMIIQRHAKTQFIDNQWFMKMLFEATVRLWYSVYPFLKQVYTKEEIISPLPKNIFTGIVWNHFWKSLSKQ